MILMRIIQESGAKQTEVEYSLDIVREERLNTSTLFFKIFITVLHPRTLVGFGECIHIYSFMRENFMV